MSAYRVGKLDQLARRLFARARLRPRQTPPPPNPFIVCLAWRLADPVTRQHFRARAREALAAWVAWGQPLPASTAREHDIDFTEGATA